MPSSSLAHALLPALVPALLLSCAGTAPAPDGVDPEANAWLDLKPNAPKLCLSSMPLADRPSKSERATLAAARTQVAAGFSDVDLSALPDHPATDVLKGGLAVTEHRDSEAREIFRDLANTWDTDACVQQAAAYTSFRAGRVAYAKPYMDAALSLAPDDEEIALLDAVVSFMADRDQGKALSRLRDLVSKHPDSARGRAWLGTVLMGQGDAEEALPHLRFAHEAELDVLGSYVKATRATGDLNTYLSLAGVSPPLPLDVREAAEPVAAYRDALGITGDKLTAVITTTMGPLRCELFWKRTPLTVGNFVGLASGTTPWVGLDGEMTQTPLYPGTVFHRVIPEFMIQGGDPEGTGSGGPGYAFVDEVVAGLGFTKPGRLAMANSGPSTNGSQWFITEKSTPHLSGKHTIFGQCDDATVELVRKIARVPTLGANLPVTPVVIQGIAFVSE